MSVFTYDEMNRPATARYGTAGAISYAYDHMGNVTEVTEDIGVTILTYDKWNRLIEMTDHEGLSLIYEYDANGNRTSLTYPDGGKAVYAYDHMDRVVSIDYDADSGHWVVAIGYAEAKGHDLLVVYNDPAKGESFIKSFEEFQTNGGRKWTQSAY